MEPSRCACGAALTRGALACGLCHAPVPGHAAAPATPAESPAASVARPGGFVQAPPRPSLQASERTFSRVQSGPMSFGPLGRTVITGLLLTPIAFIWFMSGGGIVTLVCTVPTVALPLWYLRETWRRQRIR